MMNMHDEKRHRAILRSIARRAMLERGLLPEFSKDAISELSGIRSAAAFAGGDVRDMRNLLWASIDNDDSRDLDQITVAEPLNGGAVKILVAVADVDALVGNGSAIDEHAKHNTTSIYTAGNMFPMLPERLSTDLTSLNLNEDRLAIVVSLTIAPDGSLQDSDICRACVRNRAKLAYDSVAAWLDGTGEEPQAITAVKGVAENLRVQDKTARSMLELRHAQGALTLETIEAKAVFDDDSVRDLEAAKKNRATDLIENFMVAANGVVARYLAGKNLPSICRVVRKPKKWDRIVEMAADRGFDLPGSPAPKALEEFLSKEKVADPLRFPDLSLAVIKLLGKGEYIAEVPGSPPQGHFGLAVRDYTHSTAPNRRYTDLIIHRLLKAAMAGVALPYNQLQLTTLAEHCTDAEDAVKKVERQVGKSAAALLLESRIGQKFDAIVTGAAPKGTWARLLTIPVEGKVVEGEEGIDVGDRVRVQLVSVDVQKGYIDFRNLGAV